MSFQQQPYQPAPVPKKAHRTVLIIIGSIVGGLIVLGALAPSEPANVQNQPTVATTPDNGPTPDPVVTPTNKPTVAPKTTAPKATKPAMTASQEQAVRSAENYLGFKAFSRKGLIQQLSSEYGEGFSVADATYAVDHIVVNWNEQAAKSARSYLKMKAFSRQGLIEQLESEYGEGFTHRQAVYGVTKAGL